MIDYNKWKTEDLVEERKRIELVLHGRLVQEAKEKKRLLNINGITPRDIVVTAQYGYSYAETNDEWVYSFQINHEGKLYDIYYDGWAKPASSGEMVYYDWWPVTTEENFDEWGQIGDVGDNAAFAFVPNGFSESSENIYEFRGTHTKAKKRLKECGITDIREEKADW